MRKVSFWKNGEAFLGLVFVVTGAYVLWQSLGMLHQLWGQAAEYLPLRQLADEGGKQLSEELPLISGVFIRLISCLCGVLVGITWVVSGILTIGEAITQKLEPSPLQQQELAAEILRTGSILYWRSAGSLVRWLTGAWRRIAEISPVALKLVGNSCRAILKTLLVAIVLLGVWRIFHLIPTLLKKYLDVTVSLVIPSPLPLFVVLALVLVIHLVLALSLIWVRPPAPFRKGKLVPVRGRGDINLFFAIIEEGCKLLSPQENLIQPPLRVEQPKEPLLRGTLIETPATPVSLAGKPMGYVCATLLFVLTTMGFSRLMHFSRGASPMAIQDFFCIQFSDYLLEVGFSVALIVAGIHFGEQARKLFAVRRYQSAVVFCHETPRNAELLNSENLALRRVEIANSQMMSWRAVRGADDQFAAWAKGPHRDRRFDVQVYWAEVISESIAPQSERYIVTLQNSPVLDATITRILAIPFLIDFQIDPDTT